MARKAKPQQNSRSFEYSFLNVRLTKTDEENLATMDTAEEYPLDAVFGLVAEGYKFSLSFDQKNQSFVATLSDTDEHSDFYKHILSGRGSTAFDAWVALAYRHFHMAGGDWSEIATTGGNDNRRYW